MNIVAILGRQPELSLAELEGRFGANAVTPFSSLAATLAVDTFDVQQFGGIQKAGKVVAELEPASWDRLSRDIVQRYTKELRGDGKLTLGISVYGRRDVDARSVGRTGLALKQALKKRGRSVRLVPNDGAALSTATSHHNKLGLSDNKLEIIIVYGSNSVIVADSVGSQNISALAARDQGRPKRDAFVGMLPPKLALMMINMSGITTNDNSQQTTMRILDPFCGTGVLLQEAALLGYDVYGTDLSEKMVDYSKANLDWLAVKHSVGAVEVEAGDAIEHQWSKPIHAVVAETYLGQPFSAPPAPDKLDKVRRNVDHIVGSFLKNIAPQLESGTPLCLAVPAWRDGSGRLTHIPVIRNLDSLGFTWQSREHVDVQKLIYFREDQIVARELLIIQKT
ncbi:MAG: methyltransferase domain-containing protein [Candidatus Saccharimonadales bacterium]